MLLRATKGNRVRSTSQAKPARVAPQGALIFDNWTKRRTAFHYTGRETRLRIIDASAR